MAARSTFSPQDKTNIVVAPIAVVGMFMTLSGIILRFWNDTNIRLAVIETKVSELERNLNVTIADPEQSVSQSENTSTQKEVESGTKQQSEQSIIQQANRGNFSSLPVLGGAALGGIRDGSGTIGLGNHSVRSQLPVRDGTAELRQ